MNRLPASLVSLRDHETLAHQTLDANALAYFNGGAADEITLNENRQAWQRLRLAPRVLQPLAGGHTRVPLLGRTLAHPIPLSEIREHAAALGEEFALIRKGARLSVLPVTSAQWKLLLSLEKKR